MDYRTALITGASSGLGRAMAAWFGKQSVTVYAAARRTDELESLRKEVGDSIVPFPLDVAQADDAYQKLKQLDEKTPLDLVIACAGIGDPTNGRRLDWEKVKNQINVNVLGAAATITAVLPGMVARKKGHVVGISSIAAFVALPKAAGYCASKVWLSTFLDGLRLDVEREGIAVTSIHPGFVKTPLNLKAKVKLPFLMEVDEATEKMCRAIVAKKKQFVFPWQMSALASTANALPLGLRGRITSRLG
jgi:short-subunit dehydrogenase